MRIPNTSKVRELITALDDGFPINFVGDRAELREELKFLVALAETNFAACFNANDPTDNALMLAVSSRVPHMITGGGQIIGNACLWLCAKAKENCLCGAPAFITGCDNAIAHEGDKDRCVCRTGECPWTRHTGVFL